MTSEETLGRLYHYVRVRMIGQNGLFLMLWVLSSALVVAITVALTWQAANPSAPP